MSVAAIAKKLRAEAARRAGQAERLVELRLVLCESLAGMELVEDLDARNPPTVDECRVLARQYVERVANRMGDVPHHPDAPALLDQMADRLANRFGEPRTQDHGRATQFLRDRSYEHASRLSPLDRSSRDLDHDVPE